jgi:cytochrome P450
MRGGMLWRQMTRLDGDGINGEGPKWRRSRDLIEPFLSSRAITALMAGVCDAINEAIGRLAQDVGPGKAVDIDRAHVRITQRVLTRTFMGNRIPSDRADLVGQQIAVALEAMGTRLLLPFAPSWLPLPSDRVFKKAKENIDRILFPSIDQARAEPSTTDLVSILAHATDEQGQLLPIQDVRNDVIAMFLGGTETTARTLTWLWYLLDQHPEVGRRMEAEIAEVIGGGPVAPEHARQLVYTSQVIKEVLRLYPAGWVLPRTVRKADTLGGVPLKPGDTVIISPYVTHRLPSLWGDQPDSFDPERFTEDRIRTRHPYAYAPFGGGLHRCLGSHFFTYESALVAAALLTTFKLPELVTQAPIRPKASAALTPQRVVEVNLSPR